MMSIDIFFIDWERPKFNNADHFMHHSYHKTNLNQTASPETPSIASSLKPPTTILSSASPSYDCVSAWRNYFIANEWQELITKRKISIFLHSTFVASTLLVSFLINLDNWDY
jgi:meckelin